MASSKHAFEFTRCQGAPLPKINKNASDGAAIIDQSGAAFSKFGSSSRDAYSKEASALSSAYRRERPAFDRITACKTNYELGRSTAAKCSASQISYTDPSSRPAATQAAVGGWTHADGRYKMDESSIATIRRGGGGGEGCLGVQFNVLTGAPVHKGATRAERLQNTGPNSSLNACARATDTRQGNTYNILSGKQSPTYVAPQRADPQNLKRPDQTLLRTRPW